MVTNMINRLAPYDDVKFDGISRPTRKVHQILIGLAMLSVVSAQAADPPGSHAPALRTSPTTARMAEAQPLPVQVFDVQRWTGLLREPGPALVVFTSTDCAHCPQAIERLTRHQRDEQRAGRPVPRLDVVVMDGREEPESLSAEPHFQLADRLFAFYGQAARVRHSVNPAWFGQTPYVALLGATATDGRASVRFVSGTPTDRDLRELR
jgi:hypothetical protein